MDRAVEDQGLGCIFLVKNCMSSAIHMFLNVLSNIGNSLESAHHSNPKRCLAFYAWITEAYNYCTYSAAYEPIEVAMINTPVSYPNLLLYWLASQYVELASSHHKRPLLFREAEASTGSKIRLHENNSASNPNITIHLKSRFSTLRLTAYGNTT